MADTASQSSDIVCDECYKFSLKSFFFARPKSSKDQIPDQKWGWCGSQKLCDIRKKSHCPLCRLVLKSLGLDEFTEDQSSDNYPIHYYRIPFGTYEGENSSLQSMVLDNKIKEGVDIDISKQYQTNRIHVSTNPAVLGRVDPKLARFPLIGQMNDQEIDADIMLLGDTQINLEDGFMQGRIMEKQLNFGLCRSWIDTCTRTHGESCTPVPLQGISPKPSRVIDIKKRRVVSAPPSCSYAALSYVWGKDVDQLELNKDNWARLTTAGGLDDERDDIPRTIGDAIALCSKLSVHFLWVDALCIRQDDPQDKNVQLKIMDAIYSCAYFTIVAASGSDSWAGLPGVGSKPRYAQDREFVGGLTLSTAQPTLLSSFEDSHWNTRAWTFQEGILSRRLLIFTDFGVYFKCNSALWWEDTHQELLHGKATVIHNIQTPHVLMPFWKRVLPSKPDFPCYADLVQDYTSRYMTNNTDSLNAFSGLSHALEKPFNTTFFQGLPLIFFDLALCFEIPSLQNAQRIEGFPSWSWSGWRVENGVSYDDIHEETVVICRDFHRIEYDSNMHKKLIRLCAESTSGEFLHMQPSKNQTLFPNFEDDILDSMSDLEHENLLMIETDINNFFISMEDDGYGQYSVTVAPSSTVASNLAGDKCLGTICLNPSWRRQYSFDNPFDFILICGQRIREKEKEKFRLIMLLIEKDSRGISHRIQMCKLDAEKWLAAGPIPETIYLI